MHILLCKYYRKDDLRNAPKRLRKTVFRFETMDPERCEKEVKDTIEEKEKE